MPNGARVGIIVPTPSDVFLPSPELVGTQGVYNMSAADHSGFDERGRVLITVKDGGWRLLRD